MIRKLSVSLSPSLSVIRSRLKVLASPVPAEAKVTNFNIKNNYVIISSCKLRAESVVLIQANSKGGEIFLKTGRSEIASGIN
jgi:hypothetical protein